MATPTTNRPTPERIFNIFTAFQNTAALKTGIALDVFTAIGEGANTPALLSKKCNAAERGVRILCDYLTILDLLTKEQGRYGLTQESALFLDRRSPACLASMSGFLGSEWHQRNFFALTEAVRKDRKSTRLNSSHANISYAVFCLKKKNNRTSIPTILTQTTERSIVLIVSALHVRRLT